MEKTMAINAVPVVLNTDGNKHVSIGTGAVIGDQYIDKQSLISREADNTITLGSDDKLYVKSSNPATLISNDLNNSIEQGSDGKLKVKIISTDGSNLLRRGNDNGAYVSGSDLLSTGVIDNIITVNSIDGRIQVRKQDIIDIAATDFNPVSHDINNVIIQGSDGGAYLNRAQLDNSLSVPGSDNLLIYDKDTKILSSVLEMVYENSKLKLLNHRGVAFATVDIPSADSILTDVSTVVNPDGQPAGNYFKFTFKLADGTVKVVYTAIPDATLVTAGSGISIDAGGDDAQKIYNVSVKVKSDGGIATGEYGLFINKDFAIADDLRTTNGRVDVLEEKVSNLETDTTNLETRIDNIEAATVDASQITVSATEPDTFTMKLSTGVLYPASNLI
jgi:hypothetical protein